MRTTSLYSISFFLKKSNILALSIVCYYCFLKTAWYTYYIMKKILIVEDNKDLREIYKTLFLAGEYEVKTSSNGSDALADVLDFLPDVILLDIMMPYLNGPDFLRKLKELTSIKTKVVCLTNSSDENLLEQVKTEGALMILQKSEYVGGELVRKIDSVLSE